MTTTDTTLCLNCGKHTARQLACTGCGVVPSAATRESDYFGLFGLPHKLALDLDDLGARYYALSRRFHPDLWQDSPPAEREASVRATAIVNNAYHTLKDPVRRALYWLSLHGESLGRDNERVPPALAARVFEVQGQLDELRDARGRGDGTRAEGEVRATRDELQACMDDLGARLDASFRRSDTADGAGAAALAETKTILSELSYVRTLLRDVEKELEPQWSV
jgi:molecular chaperone HscB